MAGFSLRELKENLKEKLEKQRKKRALKKLQRRIEDIKTNPSKYCECQNRECAECRFLTEICENVPKDGFLPPDPDPTQPERAVKQQIIWWVNKEDGPIPKRKILCLHDVRDSATFFERQTEVLRREVGGEHEFVYRDGPVRCTKNQDESIGANAPSASPPSLPCSWMATSSASDIKKAHTAVDAHIKEFGPFDGILGIGQGAAVATSYLIQRQLEDWPLGFEFAVICCSILVPSSDENFETDFYRDFWVKYGTKICKTVRDSRLRGLRAGELSSIMEPLATVDEPEELPLNVTREGEDIAAQRMMCIAVNELTTALCSGDTDLANQIQDLRPDEWNVGPEIFPRLHHPQVTKSELNIPTVHIWGENSSLRTQAKLVATLYDSAKMTVRHNGHHDFGEHAGVIRETALKIRKVMKKALMEKHELDIEQYVERPVLPFHPPPPGPGESGLSEGFPIIDPSRAQENLPQNIAVVDYAAATEHEGNGTQVGQNNENQASGHSPTENVVGVLHEQAHETDPDLHNDSESSGEPSGNIFDVHDPRIFLSRDVWVTEQPQQRNSSDDAESAIHDNTVGQSQGSNINYAANDENQGSGQPFRSEMPDSDVDRRGDEGTTLGELDVNTQTGLRSNKENGEAMERNQGRDLPSARGQVEDFGQDHSPDEGRASSEGEQSTIRDDSPSRKQVLLYRGESRP